MWATSSDYNTIDGFNIAVSADSGHSFSGHQNIVQFHKNWGDTQERWMLGCLVATGPNKVFVIYPDYETMTVDGKTTHPFILHYKASTDGAKSFGPAHTLLSAKEIEECIRSFAANQKSDQNVPYFAQTLSWASADPSGNIHVVWEDNRSGQSDINGKAYGKWQVRYASGKDPSFGPSEQVSNDVVCIRPPLDFIGCAADSKYCYVIWIETPNATGGWGFSGDVYVARKALK